jgi:hypothetical protein
MRLSGLVSMLCVAVAVAFLPACTSELQPGTPIGADAGNGNGDDEFNRPDAAVCLETVVQAEQATLPIDIIWAVDTSGSMSFEATTIENNLNAFAAQIDSWGLDYRVIMVAERGDGSNEVCVPAPLGGAACADGPLYRHVPNYVGSHTALAALIEGYPLYQDFLREDSAKHFVVVSDDEADNDLDDTWFKTAILGLVAPGFPAREFAPQGYTFHSIVAWGDVPGRGCDTGADIGDSYLALTELTLGVKAKVCETDWGPIFAALQAAVMEGTQLPCAFEIPPPPPGENLDPSQVNLVYTPTGGTDVTVPRVESAADCGANDGWYYDDPVAPTQIIVCPNTCDSFQADPDGRVGLQFGCSTVVL